MEETASKKFISIYGIPPDGGYGWTIVLVSFILRNIVDGIGYSSGYFVKPLQDEFKSSTLSAIALIFSLYFGMQNFMGESIKTINILNISHRNFFRASHCHCVE